MMGEPHRTLSGTAPRRYGGAIYNDDNASINGAVFDRNNAMKAVPCTATVILR